ncbi:MAG TPA: hypothetical protein DCE41_22780 [Cytophagales bacterium]|nr:hypothetical protein [Cytophagales bacterium]HAA22892.1 hypothetical protein [Cytophagales bacterium]HAP60560.1 hypothetical protein [Cytophagales bacterium]
MKYHFLPLFFFFLIGCQPKDTQTTTRQQMARELDSLYQVNQKVEAWYSQQLSVFGWDSPEHFAAMDSLIFVDSTHVGAILRMVETAGGYPGADWVGDSLKEVAFRILRLSPPDPEGQYAQLFLQAAKQGDLPVEEAAEYEDKFLSHYSKPQKYGTQVNQFEILDSATGQFNLKTIALPIQDTVGIDSLRATMGLGPWEDYLNGFGISRWE